MPLTQCLENGVNANQVVLARLTESIQIPGYCEQYQAHDLPSLAGVGIKGALDLSGTTPDLFFINPCEWSGREM
ncbi:hypothetical protein Ddc_08540 [Ditylenchus destructor]|nr:hypothetical protein Ddc_08540 [Ditylenchus destructor]